MPKQDVPLKVEIPDPSREGPAWSRVGIIAAIGFIVGIAWPRLAGVKIGPNAPDDDHPSAAALASGAPSAAPATAPSAAPNTPSPSASGAPQASGEPAGEAPAAANKELVVVGPGKIARCRDKKNKKIEDCGELQFDPIAMPKLKALSTCPSAIGLEGKMSIGFEIDFDRKEVQVVKGKKNNLPPSTINGILQCAGQELANVSLEDVAHKYKKYTVHYTAAFYPPGKHPEGDGKPSEGDGSEEAAAGSATSETEASGQATVNWDTALVRKEPKDGDVVARLVRGTKVKLVGRQNDWYKVEHGSKTGWVHRAAIGL